MLYEVITGYLERFDVDFSVIEGLATPSLAETQMLFLITDHLSESRVKTIRTTFPNLKLVPVYESDHQVV